MFGVVVLCCGLHLSRGGHDTNTKYRYRRYLRAGGKYRYFHQVSLVFDTEAAVFMVSTIACMYENLKKMSIKAQKKQKSMEVCLIELDQGKSINRVPDRILHSRPKPFLQRYCVSIKLC